MQGKNEEQAKKLTRLEFLKEQFQQDIKKAIKKNKLLSMVSPEFSMFASKAGVRNQMQQMRTPAPTQEQGFSIEDTFVEPAFFAYKQIVGTTEEEMLTKPTDLLFNFFVDTDPSKNKEYVHWMLNMYRDLVKQRKPFKQVSDKELESSMLQDGSYSDMLMGGDEMMFFEDMSKVTEALEKFDFLKKTRSIKETAKDINRYDHYTQLLKLVKPFMPAEEGSDSVDTLDHKELKAIENQVKYASGDHSLENEPRAELVYQDDKWVIVWTINKPANAAFGKYTTWCTAGTRHGNMFDHYNNDGKLFVLIKKGYGSKRAIEANPLVRLQFHFYTTQYMDANDKRIQIKEFLDENEGIKDFFKIHIVKEVLPKKGKKVSEQIKFLQDLGYGDQIIKIFKEVQPDTIDLSGFKMKPEFLEELGDIVSIESLTLSECSLTELPKSLLKLKKLRYLNVSSNIELKEIPTWVNQLTKLKDLHFVGCDIRNQVEVSNLTELTNLRMDYNPRLTHFPKGLGNCKKLEAFTISNCDIREMAEEIIGCSKLFLLDAHNNRNLVKIPLNICKLQDLHVVSLDDTMISEQDTVYMERHRTSSMFAVVKYPDAA